MFAGHYKPFSYIPRCRSSLRRCSVRKGVLKNFAIFAGEHLCLSLFLINKVAGLKANLLKRRLATLLKRNSNTDIFLWILRNFQEHLIWKTSANGCFWRWREKSLDLIFFAILTHLVWIFLIISMFSIIVSFPGLVVITIEHHQIWTFSNKSELRF